MTLSVFFFFNDTPTTEIYTLSLHDALPILQHLTSGLARHGFLAPATTAEIVMTGPPDHPAAATPTRTDGGTVTADMPYARQAAQLAAALSSAGLQVTHTAWVPVLAAGQRWRC